MLPLVNNGLFLLGELLLIMIALIIYGVIFSKVDPIEKQKVRPIPYIKSRKTRSNYHKEKTNCEKEEVKNGKI